MKPPASGHRYAQRDRFIILGANLVDGTHICQAHGTTIERKIVQLHYEVYSVLATMMYVTKFSGSCAGGSLPQLCIYCGHHQFEQSCALVRCHRCRRARYSGLIKSELTVIVYDCRVYSQNLLRFVVSNFKSEFIFSWWAQRVRA